MKSLEISKPSEELKKLIEQHPDYEIIVCVGEDCNSGDYTYTFPSETRFVVGEYLNCQAECNDEKAYISRDDLEEDLSDYYADDQKYKSLSDDEYEAVIKQKAETYDPYWKDCIFIMVD